MKSHYRPDFILHRKFYYRLIGLGLIVGIVAGVVASLYRFAIAYSQEFSQSVYAWAKNPWQILCVFLGLALLGLIVGWLIKGEPLIKGSGIPQAEGTILGFFQMRWLKILIKKFIILFQFTQIPSEIQVIAVHIRNLQQRAVCLLHEYICHRCETSLV